MGPCPSCRHDELEWAEVAGTGLVVARCKVQRGVGPPFSDEVPYVIALINLVEGFLFITRALGELSLGERVRLQWAEIQATPWPCAVPDFSPAHSKATRGSKETPL